MQIGIRLKRKENHTMRKEIVISDLSNAVLEKDRLSDFCTADKWEVVAYETSYASGNMLIASEQTFPQKLTISPELCGWYRIYVCMAGFTGHHIHLKLTNDEFSRCLTTGNLQRYCIWHSSEVVEEALWKCADMTGQSITIEKIDDGRPHSSNLLWLRFVPMENDEIIRHKNKRSKRNMFAHMDGDFHQFDVPTSPRDFCRALYTMADSDVGILCQEITNDLVDYSMRDPHYLYRNKWGEYREDYFKKLSNNRDAVYKEEIDYAHKLGIKMFAALRTQLSNFSFPMSQPLF